MTTPPWQNAIRRASFRGVEFHTDDRTGSGGRRIVTFEYPKRDTPSSEDMGRQQRTWRERCYVIGPDYMAARDRLIRALEAPGGGRYVDHFSAYEVTAGVEAFDYLESSLWGGYCEFNITFVEGGSSGGVGGIVSALFSMAPTAAALVTAAVQGWEQRRG